LRVIVPMVGALLLTIYLLRDLVVWLLFDPRFLPMTQLFGFQLAGDMLKIVRWVYAYVMIGRGLTVVFIATEVGFSCLSVVLVRVFTHELGLVGASVGYAVSYALYAVVVYCIYRRAVSMRRAVSSPEVTSVLAQSAVPS